MKTLEVGVARVFVAVETEVGRILPGDITQKKTKAAGVLNRRLIGSF